MHSDFLPIALLLLASLFLAGCQTGSEPARPGFSVTIEQQYALDDIFFDVLDAAQNHRNHSNRIDKQVVADLVSEQDVRVRGILDADQWRNYNLNQRDFVTDELISVLHPQDGRRLSSGYGRRTSPPPTWMGDGEVR